MSDLTTRERKQIELAIEDCDAGRAPAATAKVRRVLKSHPRNHTLPAALRLIEAGKYKRAANVLRGVLEGHEPVEPPSLSGPGVGLWVQAFLSEDWTDAQRDAFIADAASLGCTHLAVNALPVWDNPAPGETSTPTRRFFLADNTSYAALTARGMQRHIRFAEAVLAAGMIPVVYGWAGAGERGGGYAGLGDWRAWLDAFGRIHAVMPPGVLYVDGMEPYTNEMPATPPLNEYSRAFLRIVPGAYVHHAHGDEAVAPPEIHWDAGRPGYQSTAKGGIVTNDGGYGHPSKTIWPVGREFACLPAGDLRAVVADFVERMHEAARDGRDFVLVLFTADWRDSAPGRHNDTLEPVYALVEPYRSVIEGMVAATASAPVDAIDLSRAQIVGRAGTADVRGWRIVQSLTVTAFREGEQRWAPPQPWSATVADGPNGGTLWVGRKSIDGALFAKPVEHLFPVGTRPDVAVQYMSPNHIDEIDDGWPPAIRHIRTGEEIYVMLTAPAWLGDVGIHERTNVVRVTWGM